MFFGVFFQRCSESSRNFLRNTCCNSSRNLQIFLSGNHPEIFFPVMNSPWYSLAFLQIFLLSHAEISQVISAGIPSDIFQGFFLQKLLLEFIFTDRDSYRDCSWNYSQDNCEDFFRNFSDTILRINAIIFIFMNFYRKSCLDISDFFFFQIFFRILLGFFSSETPSYTHSNFFPWSCLAFSPEIFPEILYELQPK